MSTSRGETRLWSLLKQAGAMQEAKELQQAALQDHTLWEHDFGRWALGCCLFRDRCFGGVKALHSHFNDWCIANQTVGCMLETFEALLESEGFLMAGGLVAGVVLKDDLNPRTPQRENSR